MKTVCDVNMCAGCMACVDACPKDAVSIIDSLEFYNAIVDEDKCIRCNACIRVCQQRKQGNFVKPIKYFQGWAKVEEDRMRGSSGGVAYAIEKAFVQSGGIVASCSFSKGVFGFRCVDNEQELMDFAGSKYTKSNPIGIYKEIHSKLKSGNKVLFVGLPCQVAAVKNFIKESEQKNLYTIDLICHGTPSPRLLSAYLSQYSISLDSVDSLKFRTKTRFQVSNNYIPVEGNLEYVIIIPRHFLIVFVILKIAIHVLMLELNVLVILP